MVKVVIKKCKQCEGPAIAKELCASHYQVHWRKITSPRSKVKYLSTKARLEFERRVRLFGLTLEVYALLESKGCAICGKTKDVEGRRLSMDHDHKTGRFRGLLCNRCNAAVGNIEGRPELLVEIPQYLGQWTKA